LRYDYRPSDPHRARHEAPPVDGLRARAGTGGKESSA
jgi:hypothetical protein